MLKVEPMPDAALRNAGYVRFDAPDLPLHFEAGVLPAVSEGEVLVRISCSTVCGSDLHTFSGRRKEPVPTIPGHEYIGTVVAVVGDVKDLTGCAVRTGDRVTWSVMASCRECDRCVAGMPQKCRQLFKYGHANLDSHPFSGGFATHCLLRNGTAIVKVSRAVPDSVAAPASCATATVSAVMRQFPETKGRRFLVLGAGLLGLTATAMADAAGASEIHLCDPDENRRHLGKAFGATQLLSTTPDLEYDCVIEVSGHPDAVETAIRAVSVGGHIVLAGSVFPAGSVQLNPESIVRRLASIHGVHNYHPKDLLTAVDFLTRYHRTYPFCELVHEPFSLENVAQAVSFAQQNKPIRVALASAYRSEVVDEILSLFEKHGDSEYGGEPVTQREHALQCADLAVAESASSELVVAALVHDVGHLLHDLPDDAPESGIDDVHEVLGHRFLSERFGPAVSEPVRLHVDAKRYLCATDDLYRQQLSDASVELQGGPMTETEISGFESLEYAQDALRLRRWDDTAKDTEQKTSRLDDFIPQLEAAAWSRQ